MFTNCRDRRPRRSVISDAGELCRTKGSVRTYENAIVPKNEAFLCRKKRFAKNAQGRADLSLGEPTLIKR